MSSITSSSTAPPPESAEQPLPELTPLEFRQYNRMADTMNVYHEHFRQTWSLLFSSCTVRKRPQGMSLRQFIATGLRFASQLELHHTIEEQHVFPHLGKKMPPFQQELEMPQQHKKIHKGLMEFEKYLKACDMGERDLELGELREIMEEFREVLWEHLDEEVRLLGAENMRKYWTLEEMRAMNF